jgi:hypothetical protein
MFAAGRGEFVTPSLTVPESVSTCDDAGNERNERRREMKRIREVIGNRLTVDFRFLILTENGRLSSNLLGRR